MLSALAIASCTQHSSNAPSLELQNTYLIDDSQGKLYRTPHQVICETDQYMDFIIFPNYIIRYDFATKKLTTLFDSIHFNIDSLNEKTYGVINKNKFHYLPHAKDAVQNANKNLYQIAPIAYSNDKYYIPIGIKTNAEFVTSQASENNTSNIKNKVTEMLEKRKVDSIKRIYGNSKVFSVEMNNFIIETDKNFNQTNAYAINYTDNECFLAKRKRGYVHNNNYYFSLLPQSLRKFSDEKDLTGYEPSSYFSVFSLTKDGIASNKPLINKGMIKSDQYCLTQFNTRIVSYSIHNDKLIASLGKELLNLTDNSLYAYQPILEEKEYISNIGFSNDYIVYTTDKYIRRKQITKELLSFGITDTIGVSYLKVQDIKTNEIVLTQELKQKSIYTLSPTCNLYEYNEKGDSLKVNSYKLKLK